jgi:bisphosphoglycerate-independent phosphoglycerate mutase (AlkP superfamily)
MMVQNMADSLITNLDQKLTSEPSPRPRPVVLLLLDGWGIAPASAANLITATPTPTWLSLIKEYPVALLATGAQSLNARYLMIGTGQEQMAEGSGVPVTLTSVVAAANLRQIKIAETERLAALTNIFNGYADTKAAGEDWRIISSEAGDKTVKPLLALKRTVKEICREIDAAQPRDLSVAAVPYLDLVARSGDLAAAKKAVAALDKYLRSIVTAVQAKAGVLIISAAAGNMERIRNLATEMVDTEITANPVPLIIVGAEFVGRTIGLADPLNDDLSLLAPAGTLADLAPTILGIMGLVIPPEMTGKNLLSQG